MFVVTIFSFKYINIFEEKKIQSFFDRGLRPLIKKHPEPGYIFFMIGGP